MYMGQMTNKVTLYGVIGYVSGVLIVYIRHCNIGHQQLLIPDAYL